MQKKNKAIVREFLQSTLAGDSGAGDSLLHPAASHVLKGSLAFYLALAAFPDAELSIEHMVEEGDTVTVLCTYTGTHGRPLMGVEGSGTGVTGRVAFNFRVSEGSIAETWAEFEPWGLMKQLGISPLEWAAPPLS